MGIVEIIQRKRFYFIEIWFINYDLLPLTPFSNYLGAYELQPCLQPPVSSAFFGTLSRHRRGFLHLFLSTTTPPLQ